MVYWNKGNIKGNLIIWYDVIIWLNFILDAITAILYHVY